MRNRITRSKSRRVGNGGDYDKDYSSSSSSEQQLLTDDHRGTILLNDINFVAREGDLIFVVGAVGSGKTSLLNAILGEMKLVDGYISVPCRDGGIAYTCQKSWLLSDTLLQNICFGLEYDEEKFKDVVRVSGLLQDLEDLGSVKIEIGERGVNLSGGQKYRVQLARACYRDADLYLLDDPLAAVDTHVGAHIREECILKYLKGKTRIVVTNQIQELQFADYIVLLEQGRIAEQGTYEQLLEKKGEVYELVKPYLSSKDQDSEESSEESEGETQDRGVVDIKREDSDDSDDARKRKKDEEGEEVKEMRKGNREFLIKKEESESGVLSLKTISFYFVNMGCMGWIPLLLILLFALLAQFIHSGSDFYLAQWLSGRVLEEYSQEYSTLLYYDLPPNDETPDFYYPKTIEDSTWNNHHGGNGNALENTPGIYDHVGYTISFVATPYAYNLTQEEITSVNASYECPPNEFNGSCHKVVYNTVWISDWNNGEKVRGGLTTLGAALIYFSLGVLAIFLAACCRDLLIVNFALNASKNLHDSASKAVLRAPMSFFETTPHGRITHRFSSDVSILDNRVPMSMQAMVGLAFLLSGMVILICIVSKGLGIVIVVPICATYFAMYGCVRYALVPLRRYETLTKSPIMTTMAEAYDGISVLRVYDSIGRFHDRIRDQIDVNQRVTLMYESVSRMLRALSRSLFSILVFFVLMLGVPMVLYGTGYFYLESAFLALMIMCGLILTDSIEHLNRFLIITEVDGSFVERLQHYTENIPQEAPSFNKQLDPALENDGWPVDGVIQFHKYSLRYHTNHPYALIDLNLEMRGTVGIVGQTGSGKSTLVKSLLRLVENEKNELTRGHITIDRINIRQIGLHLLRKSISFIPQDPMLFQGSIKYNLDPFGEFSEGACKEALRKSSMDKRIRRRIMVERRLNQLPGEDYNLNDVQITEGGKNFSVGERQLICLSRAIIKESKILVLDECTASVDTKLDNIIQNTLRTYFKDCTILTIAHRLNTVIDYEKIVVMKDGRVCEYDSPANLLTNPEFSEFKNLVNRTGENSAKFLTEVATGERTLVFDVATTEEEIDEAGFTGNIELGSGDWKYREVEDIGEDDDVV